MEIDVITTIQRNPKLESVRSVAVIVAHPDDETLWAGGLILSHPEWSLRIASICRGGDADRAPKFQKVLARLSAEGGMANLDDGPEQTPLSDHVLRETVLSLLPERDYDLIITHAPCGEYTRHRRHEEVSRAVEALWDEGRLRAGGMLQFAYEDGGGTYLPRSRMDACLQLPLSDVVWTQKYRIITQIYGFSADSWEARMVPKTEAFHSLSMREPV